MHHRTFVYEEMGKHFSMTPFIYSTLPFSDTTKLTFKYDFLKKMEGIWCIDILEYSIVNMICIADVSEWFSFWEAPLWFEEKRLEPSIVVLLPLDLHTFLSESIFASTFGPPQSSYSKLLLKHIFPLLFWQFKIMTLKLSSSSSSCSYVSFSNPVFSSFCWQELVKRGLTGQFYSIFINYAKRFDSHVCENVVCKFAS